MGGRSSTSNATTQTDNRRVIGEGGISAENSSVTQNVTHNTLAPEVVDSALSFADAAGSNALAFADKSSGRAFAFGDAALNFSGDTVNRSLQSVDRATDSALAFGGDALAGAYDFGAKAMTHVTNVADTSMEHSAAAARSSALTARAALDTAADTFGDALAFGAGSLAKAFDAASETGAFVKDAYADAKGRGALTDKILIGAIIAMAVVALAAARRG